MIGNPIAGSDSLSEKSGGQKNRKFKTIDQITINLDDTKWNKFKREVKAANGDTIKINTAIDNSGLEQLKNLYGLSDYAVKQSKSGKDIEIDDINALIQNQDTIMSQAHGLSGVNKAIKEYNKITDKSSRSKFAEAMSQSNASLGDYLKGLNGASGGLVGYAGSLAAASLKTIGLSAATMALNAAVSFGTSVLIESLIGGISYLINYEEKQKEAFEKAKQATEENAKAVRSLRSEMSDTSSKASELSSEYATLVKGVDPLTNENKSLSTEDYERFLEVSNELAELFPSLTHNYDENGNAILGLSGDVDTVTASIGRLVEQQNNLAKADMREHLEDYINGTEDAGGAFEVLEGNKEEVKDAEKELETFKETYDGMINQQGGKYFGQDKIAYNEYLDDVKNKFGKEAYDALFDATVYGEGDGSSNTYGIDFSKLELDDSVKDKITNSYNTFYQDLQTTLSIKQSELETKNKEISDTMMVWVEDIGLYKDGDPAFQRAIETMVGSIQWSDLDIDEGNLDEAKRFIQDIVLNPLANACADPSSKLRITNALSSLFTFDFSELNYKESSEKIKGFLSTIMDAFNAGKPDEEKKTLTDMYDMFHLENYEKTSTEMGNSLAGIATGKSGLLGFDPVEYGKLVNYTKDFTQSQAEAWLVATSGAKSAEEAIRLYQESLNITSFTQLWDSIGTTGDETVDKKHLAEKERLEELAAAGKLTEKELKNSSLANVFKETGTSIEEATEKINNMKSSAEQLASMKTGISSISSILGEKKAGNDIGADTLSGMPDDLKAHTKEYEHFVEVLGDGTSDMDKCRDAANKLATAYVNSNNFLANLTDGTKDYYISVLDEMGVENAAEVVTNALNRQKIDAKIATFNLKNASKQEIDQLGTYISSLDDSRTALGYYTLQQQIANNNALDTSESILNLQKLAEHCGITGEAISLMSSLAKDMKKVDYYTTGEGKNDKNAGIEISNANSEIKGNKKRLEKIINKGATVSTSPKDKPTSPKDSDPTSNGKNKDKSKSTQQIDWISRALDRLSTRLDLVKTKYDNLFNNEKAKDSDSLLKLQNKNLNDQYKILTKTEKYQDKAAKRYSKKAEKVKISKNKKEDASLKKAVENGRIKGKGSMKKLIAAYGEKKAEKIQKYQNWYDKSQEAKKNKISTQISKRENRIQRYQNLADNADSKRKLAQAQKENAKTAESKNELIDKEIDHLTTSYDYQIKIAKLEKDSLKVKQLEEEKAKEILDLQIEQHQNLADQYQSTLDQYSAEKELATKAADKNNLIEKEKAATQALYAEKIAIAGLEGNISEQYQLQAELQKQLRDLDIEQHQNLADEYQAKLDMYSAEKDNLNTADEKNAVIDQEKAATQALYAEKIVIARLEGDISKEQQLQAELTRQMVVLEKEKLDNIAAYYSNLRKITELQNKNLSNAADELEARGYIVTSKLYSSQIALNNETKKNREEELMMLEEQHDKIKEGTQEWYDSLDAIQACKDGISELIKSSIELEKAIRNVEWQLFEKLSSRLDLISSEYDLAIKLMSNKKLTDDDTGNFTEEGTATLGAYYSQLVLTQEKTKNLWNTLDAMKKHIDNGDSGYTDPVVLDEYNEKYQEYINLIENEYDIQQNLIDLMKEKYQAELDYLQDLINKRKELLQAEKDAYDYQRSIEEKTKNIGTIQKQMVSLSGDDSEGAKTKLQQLQAKLDEANQDLADTEYQQWISDQQKMLDNLYNEYEAFIDDKLNDTSALLQEAITYLNNIGEPVFDTLEKYYKEYGYNPTEDFKNINTALGKDGSIATAIGEAATTIINHLEQQQKYQGMADDVETEISEIGNVYSDVSAIERFNKAKTSFDQLATAGDNGENIQNYVSSSSASTLDTAGKEIQKIYASVQEVMDAINVVNLDNESDYNETNLQRLEKANRLYENLSTSGKQLLAADWKNTLDYRNLQANHWKGEADRIKREQDALRDRQIENLTYAIKSTYGKSAVDYATNIQNASTAEIGIATAIQRRGLNRGDGFNSPNDNAIQKIAEMINTSGLGVYINPTADALWEYMQNIGFSHGGIAKTLQKIPAMNGDDGWITVKRGEAVLTPEQTKAFHTLADNLGILNPSVDLLTAISKRPVASLPENGYSSTLIEGVDFHFELPNVVDSDSFIREMQTNPKVEKVIKTMLWDKNSLSKHRI